MKLLIITQKVDQNDPVLGFMHGWLHAFAERSEKLTVICLQKGEHALPPNVRVLSLGKESGVPRCGYIANFFRYAWQYRADHDAVFVHMNQEYLLLGGWLWKLLGKKCFMWRNHHSGDWRTHLAAMFCGAVFCTSKYSYTARFKKTKLMPVGIDTEIFRPTSSISSGASSMVNRNVLFLARMAPVKKPHVLIEAVSMLAKRGVAVKLDLYGDPLPADVGYYEGLKDMVKREGLDEQVKFFAGIPNMQTVAVYQSHDVCVNLSSSGMYDKTIFEAMACGSLVLVSNRNLEGVIDSRCIFKEGDVADLAAKLSALLSLSISERSNIIARLRTVAEENNLKTLVGRLITAMS
ncbi:MAG: glycosyltransferase [Patescibacteria group bacterium]